MLPGGHSEPDTPDFGTPEVSVGIKNETTKKPRKQRRFTKKQIEFFRKISKKRAKRTYTTNEEMTELGIPDFLQDAYLNGTPPPKILKLRDWQRQLCLTPEWQNMESTVLLVPTSGGKTVAADISISQMLKNDPKAKAIYALPFVALANEKYNEYEKRFSQFSVRPYYQNIGGSDFRTGNIAVCTFEKAHSLINASIIGGYSDKIKLVIIDEVHMIGEEGRGTVIEALIIKLLLMQHKPRIVALTATINEHDAKRLATWIGGFPFIWKSRPAPIKQFVKKKDGSLCRLTKDGVSNSFMKLKSADDDKEHLMPLIRTLLSKRPDSTILIFVNSRNDTVTLSKLIASHMFDDTLQLPKVPDPTPEVKEGRMNLIKKMMENSGFIDESTCRCIKAGVIFHHAGVLLQDRTLIEEAARNRTISVLVATTTLSAGVNIYGVSRVIIHNIYRRGNDGKRKAISSAQYTQMVGRAGRNGVSGEAYVIARSESPVELNEIAQLSKTIIPNINPHLAEGEEADKFFLHCLSTRLLPPTGMRKYVSKCLKFNNEDKPEIDGYCTSITSRLKNNKLIDQSLNSTKFGMAVAGSALSIEEGLALNKTINNAQDNLCINDEVHLLFLCVSQSTALSVRPFPYDSPLWKKIFETHGHVISLITKMSPAQIDHLQDLVHIYGGDGRINPEIDKQLDKVMVAVILKDLINEMPLKDISMKYSIDLGTIQKLQMECASYAGQINRFCEISGAGILAAALNKFRQRLNFAARTDLLALMSIPSCTRETARMLVDKGIISPVELSTLSIEQCSVLIVPEGGTVNDEIIELSKKLITEASMFAESLSRIEELEDRAVMREKA